MEISWIVTIPPLIVLLIAFLTRNVLYALIGGILSSAYLITQQNVAATFTKSAHALLQETALPALFQRTGEYDHIYTFGFLIFLGILIELITNSGGFTAYTRYMSAFIRSPRQASFLPLFTAPFFFIDDYLNNLVMGSIVRPIFDRFRLARIRLAYILNATSSSQCLLVPLSSWAAVIIIQLKVAGISCSLADNPAVLSDPYSLYLAAIPCMLYPIVSIFSAWVVSYKPYGPIMQLEHITSAAPIAHEEDDATVHSSLSNLLVPLGSFLCMIPLTLMFSAGWRPLYSSIGWCEAIKQVDGILIALFWASLIACVISILFFKATGRLSWKQIGSLSIDGFLFMKNSLLLLLFAWTLTNLMKELQTSTYLAHIIMSNAPLMIIPAACFLTATFITAAIGSSWGMMSIMIPLIIPMIIALGNVPLPATPEQFALLIPTLGALLSGAAAGPQLSPITDAAIISSGVAGISPIEHIRTMIPYTIAPLIASICGFLLLAIAPQTLMWHLLILGTVMLVTVCIHLLYAKISRMQSQ